MTVLLNGCSYGCAWQSFPGVNLSMPGGSFYRSVRTTVEYAALYGAPDAVLVPITFIDRDEYASEIAQDKPIEGPYASSATVQELRQLNEAFNCLHDTNYGAWDRFFLQLVLFCAWLDQNNIKYLMWDSCNRFDRQHIQGYRAVEKLRYVEQNPGVIDLFRFCANQYMHEQGAQSRDPLSVRPEHRHYRDRDHGILHEKLRVYITENNLGIEL